MAFVAGGASVLATIHSNTILNMNQSSGDVQCGQDLLSVIEFKQKCGVDVGTSSARRPDAEEIDSMARQWLGMGRESTRQTYLYGNQ
jgi:hypothetical protein